MKSILVIMFAAFSLLGPAHKRNSGAANWPSAMPHFVGGAPECAYELDDGSLFASLTTLRTVDEVLAAARTEYTAAGWQLAPISASDMLLFTRGNAVAIVLARLTPSGTCITTFQK